MSNYLIQVNYVGEGVQGLLKVPMKVRADLRRAVGGTP